MQVMACSHNPTQTLRRVYLCLPCNAHFAVRHRCRRNMAAPTIHACHTSARPLKISTRVHSSVHSSFLSGSALYSGHQQPACTNTCKQTTMMSRYRGPRLRIVRRLGDLPGLTRKQPDRKTPPGQHGATAKKPSQYGIRLMEKQKLRFNYGVTEHQLINYVKRARKMQGSTGENLLQLLEMRLDSVVFRLGMAPTVSAARQIVAHGHITVNGRRVDIPSYYCRPGEKVGVHAQKQSKALVTTFYEQGGATPPSHLSMNKESLEATVNSVVSRQDVGLTVNELLIVEYYSRKV